MALRPHLAGYSAWAYSFQHRDFRFLWGSTFLYSIGWGMDQVSLGWLVLKITEDPFMVGVATAARMAPLFFLGILSGTIADRVDRRLFLRFVTLGGTAVAGVMALITLREELPQVWQVIALASAMGCVFAFVLTLRQAYTCDVVGPQHALNGLALTALSQGLGGMVGSILAGAIIAAAGVGEQYLVVGGAYIAATLVLTGTRHSGQAVLTEPEPVLQNLRGYIQLIRQNRTLLTLMVLAAVTEILGFSHMTLLPVFARDVLEVGSVGLGFMTAVRQAGMMIGLMVLASLGDIQRRGLLLFFVAAGFGLGLMSFSLSANLAFFLVVLLFVNAFASSVDTLYKTLMQANVPNEQRGRAMGSWVFSIGVAPIGHLGVGGMAGALGAPTALLINGGVLAFIAVVAAIGLPRIRQLA